MKRKKGMKNEKKIKRKKRGLGLSIV